MPPQAIALDGNFGGMTGASRSVYRPHHAAF
jgi:hypothetical protein